MAEPPAPPSTAPAGPAPEGPPPAGPTPGGPAQPSPARPPLGAGSDGPDWGADDADDDAPAPAGRGGLTLRHPLLLVLVLAGSVILMLRSWPQVAYLLRSGEAADCGNLSDRPILRAEGQPVPALSHDTWCTLNGVVESLYVYATGEARDTGDIRTRDQGRKYYVKLNGEDMFAVLDAGRPEVAEYRIRKGNLFGYEVTGPGRIIDLSQVPGFADTDRFLRHRFRVTEGKPVLLYDTTESPNDRWPYAVVSGLMLLTALLALIGLIRLGLARRAA